MAQKQVVRLIVLALAAVIGGLCSAQAQRDLTAQKSPQPTVSSGSLSSVKLEEKVPTPPESKSGVLVMDPNVTSRIRSPLRPAQISPAALRRLQSAVTQLDWGTATFSLPKSMPFGEEQTITVVFTRTVPLDQLRKRLAEIVGVIKLDQIEVPNLVKAELIGGESFQIVPVMPQEQPVTSAQEGLWKWLVTPTQPGRHALHLVLSSEVQVNGEKIPCDIKAYEEPVDVVAPPVVGVTGSQKVVGFLKGNWQWLWTALLVPVAGVLWKRYRKKSVKASGEA